ncbi:MAG: SDR family NAD(P)-dependent oxidoreductase, partial [SAR202 cluster bacterium]|nr:SDR family NAD(P)-dependent oxidoreductase [SAR202 cluster bacterium]
MSSPQPLLGKVALITGAGSGIGKAMAHTFSASGAHVIVNDVNDVGGETVAKEIGGIFLKADLADMNQTRQLC